MKNKEKNFSYEGGEIFGGRSENENGFVCVHTHRAGACSTVFSAPARETPASFRRGGKSYNCSCRETGRATITAGDACLGAPDRPIPESGYRQDKVGALRSDFFFHSLDIFILFKASSFPTCSLRPCGRGRRATRSRRSSSGRRRGTSSTAGCEYLRQEEDYRKKQKCPEDTEGRKEGRNALQTFFIIFSSLLSSSKEHYTTLQNFCKWGELFENLHLYLPPHLHEKGEEEKERNRREGILGCGRSGTLSRPKRSGSPAETQRGSPAQPAWSALNGRRKLCDRLAFQEKARRRI